MAGMNPKKNITIKNRAIHAIIMKTFAHGCSSSFMEASDCVLEDKSKIVVDIKQIKVNTEMINGISR